MNDECSHGSYIRQVTPSSPNRCGGHVGCCNDSKNRHAEAHFHATGHPIIQSFEPWETWRYCYADDALLPDGEPLRRIR